MIRKKGTASAITMASSEKIPRMKGVNNNVTSAKMNEKIVAIFDTKIKICLTPETFFAPNIVKKKWSHHWQNLAI